MNEEILNQINTMLTNAGYTGTVTATDENTVTISIAEPSTPEPAEPSTSEPADPSIPEPTEPAEHLTLEAIIEQQNQRIEALTNKLNEIFKISPNAQPKNEWESYLDNPNSATYRAMKEAGLIKENNNA